MSPGLVLLALRLLMGVALLGFLAYILLTLRRDLQHHAPQMAAVPPARLVIKGGGTDEVTFPLQSINLIGRAADNTIQLDADVVSAHHARLSYLSGWQWWLEDLGSRNGTSVNGIPVEGPIAITEGDRISFGTVECVLEVESPNPASAPDVVPRISDPNS